MPRPIGCILMHTGLVNAASLPLWRMGLPFAVVDDCLCDETRYVVEVPQLCT